MRKAPIAAVAALIVAAIVAAVLVITANPESPTFDEGDAEAAFEMAINRCPGPRFEGKVSCDRAADGFACRAEGGYHGSFEMPDAENPQITLVC